MACWTCCRTSSSWSGVCSCQTSWSNASAVMWRSAWAGPATTLTVAAPPRLLDVTRGTNPGRGHRRRHPLTLAKGPLVVVGAPAASWGPRCRGAHAWAALGHLREAELRLEEQARTHRLKARLQGLCRRSPPGGDRWHIRQPVAAARFTAVLPRGSSGDTEEPAGTGRGTGTQRKDRCSGGSGDLGGGRREPGGSGLAAGGAAQGRGRPPPATRRHLRPGPLRHSRSGPGLLGTRHAHRPAIPEPAPSCTVYPSRASSLRSSLGDP
jgi:hypothetical protein